MLKVRNCWGSRCRWKYYFKFGLEQTDCEVLTGFGGRHLWTLQVHKRRVIFDQWNNYQLLKEMLQCLRHPIIPASVIQVSICVTSPVLLPQITETYWQAETSHSVGCTKASGRLSVPIPNPRVVFVRIRDVHVGDKSLFLFIWISNTMLQEYESSKPAIGHNPVSLIFILMLSSHLLIGIPIGPFQNEDGRLLDYSAV
jgi:hypothetical protein